MRGHTNFNGVALLFIPLLWWYEIVIQLKACFSRAIFGATHSAHMWTIWLIMNILYKLFVPMEIARSINGQKKIRGS